MVDTEGCVEIASRRQDGQRGEERKVDLVVGELKRYKVKVAGLQETKWFGNGVYNVEGAIVLTSGRDVPEEDQAYQRGEGVAIVLIDWAVNAWKTAGSQWKSWSSRTISACLKVGNERLHVISCYAPTRSARREEKDQFYDELDAILSSIPTDEKYILLGDFNARVGSREQNGEQWDGVRGPNGHRAINDAGKELLTFLNIHQATICNTWFVKKEIHKVTWQHPKCKKWGCIDYVIMKQKDRRTCLDVSIMRGAEYNTDHQFLCATVRMDWRCRGQKKEEIKSGRYDISKLLNNTDESLIGDGEKPLREDYLDSVVDNARSGWPEDGTAEEKWEKIQSAILETSDELLGVIKNKQPDWFQESEDELRPYLVLRNNAYRAWLSSSKSEDLMKFKKTRYEARRAIRKAKNDWFTAKASQIDKQRFGGKEVWKNIRDLQRGRRGRLPTRVVNIIHEDGNPCVTPSDQHQRWRRHFTSILDLQSHYDVSELHSVRQREVDVSLGEQPKSQEIAKALSKLKNGKAPKSSNILPEMLKAGRKDKDFVSMIANLLASVWEERKVPKEWVDAILIPIPKKGDLKRCDNWRGIALLEVAGKMAARIIQDRLQKVAKRELPESQCGFRKARGCTDMIFSVRQLVEKSIEHNTKLYIIICRFKKSI